MKKAVIVFIKTITALIGLNAETINKRVSTDL